MHPYKCCMEYCTSAVTTYSTRAKPEGCMWLLHSCIIPYSTCRGVLTGLYPHCYNSTTSVVSDYDHEGQVPAVATPQGNI